MAATPKIALYTGMRYQLQKLCEANQLADSPPHAYKVLPPRASAPLHSFERAAAHEPETPDFKVFSQRIMWRKKAASLRLLPDEELDECTWDSFCMTIPQTLLVPTCDAKDPAISYAELLTLGEGFEFPLWTLDSSLVATYAKLLCCVHKIPAPVPPLLLPEGGLPIPDVYLGMPPSGIVGVSVCYGINGGHEAIIPVSVHARAAGTVLSVFRGRGLWHNNVPSIESAGWPGHPSSFVTLPTAKLEEVWPQRLLATAMSERLGEDAFNLEPEGGSGKHMGLIIKVPLELFDGDMTSVMKTHVFVDEEAATWQSVWTGKTSADFEMIRNLKYRIPVTPMWPLYALPALDEGECNTRVIYHKGPDVFVVVTTRPIAPWEPLWLPPSCAPGASMVNRIGRYLKGMLAAGVHPF